MATKGLITSPHNDIDHNLSPDNRHHSLSNHSSLNLVSNNISSIKSDFIQQHASKSLEENNFTAYNNHNEDDDNNSVHLFKDCLESDLATNLNNLLHPLQYGSSGQHDKKEISLFDQEKVDMTLLAEESPDHIYNRLDKDNTILCLTNNTSQLQEQPLLNGEATPKKSSNINLIGKLWKKPKKGANNGDNSKASGNDAALNTENLDLVVNKNTSKCKEDKRVSENVENTNNSCDTDQTTTKGNNGKVKVGKGFQASLVGTARNVFNLGKVNAYESVETGEEDIVKDGPSSSSSGDVGMRDKDSVQILSECSNPNFSGNNDGVNKTETFKSEFNNDPYSAANSLTRVFGASCKRSFWKCDPHHNQKMSMKLDQFDNGDSKDIPGKTPHRVFNHFTYSKINNDALKSANNKLSQHHFLEIPEMEQLFTEPDNYHSYDLVWNTSKGIFSFVSLLLYRVFTAILAIPLAFIWALLMTISCILNVWFLGPIISFLCVWMELLQRVWSACCKTFITPIVEAFWAGKWNNAAHNPNCVHCCSKGPHHVIDFAGKNGEVKMTNGNDQIAGGKIGETEINP
ncbi:unnamed protein product [Gordionus sp. m RMFG-2023]|uniref:uncharacterized protein LOC135923801 n=1 Tax=Gordionus sp. m RMFG-2023 TaxID=3053472 RepID=UPI0030E2FBB0